MKAGCVGGLQLWEGQAQSLGEGAAPGQGGVSHQGPPTGDASVGRSRAPVAAWCPPFKLVFSRPSSCPLGQLFHTKWDGPMLDPGGGVWRPGRLPLPTAAGQP